MMNECMSQKNTNERILNKLVNFRFINNCFKMIFLNQYLFLCMKLFLLIGFAYLKIANFYSHESTKYSERIVT